jgi:hypothetical protein
MITIDDLKKLATAKGPCLSVFEPLRDTFSQVTKADTRLIGAAQRADELLVEKGFDADARANFLRPIFKVARNTNWAGRNGSVVIFRAPGFTKASFWPDSLDPRVKLSEEFFVLPLLAGLSAQRNFWLLALSINRIRLFRGAMQKLTEVELPKDLPQNLAEAGGFDQPDHDLESRSSAGPSTGQMTAVRSGTSSLHETRGRHLHDYFRMIDRVLQPVFARTGDPLILAAVSRELAIYREVNTYPRLEEQAIHGSPDALSEERMSESAEEIMAAASERAAEQYRRDMDTAAGRGLFLKELPDIREAAQRGQIERLFIGTNLRDNEDMVNSAALAVIHNSGTIACCEALGVNEVAGAILRYRFTEPPKSAMAASHTRA